MPIKPNNFVINAADLTYILKQIKIAEATSLGYTSTPLSILQAIMNATGASAANAAQLPFGLRTVDGTFNNLLVSPTGTFGTAGYNPGTSEFGAADTLFPRLTDPVYRNELDGDSMYFGPGAPVITNTNYAGSGSVADADPRIISNLIVDMTLSNPAAIEAALERAGITGAEATAARDDIMAANYGQFEIANAAQAKETAALATLAIETSQQAAAATAAANAAIALTAANAAVTQDVIDLAAATAASNAADATLATAQTADTAADLTLAAYNTALPLNAYEKSEIALGRTDLLVTSLGAVGSVLDAADHTAMASVLSAATAASTAAAAELTALQTPGVAPADLAAAELAADSTALLVSQLTALQTALQVDNILDQAEFDAAGEAFNTAIATVDLAWLSSEGMNASQVIAQANATSTQAALDTASSNALAKQALENVAIADLAASQLVQSAAVGANSSAQTALTTANSQLTAAQSAAAAATAASDAADGPAAELDALLTSYGIEHDPSGSLVIQALSPDIGLSPSFNSWMTYFGQFFDHGLDLVTKGNAGTVYIPLQADDPLVLGPDGVAGTSDDLPAHLRFMALTRATQTLDANGIPQHENTTTSFIDQNQTYTSHPAHQVFLREYVKDAAGHAVSTGKLLDGTAATGSVAGAIGNWTDVKAQALEMLGIRLGDFDVHNVPLLLTDQYGKFIPGANGYAQMVMKPDATHATNWLKEGTAAGITTAGSIGTGHAFLNDIAHHAAPAVVDHDHNPATPKIAQTADVDTDIDQDGTIEAWELIADDGNNLTYDDEMLNAHAITGDGRGNENIALTTVHSIFHSEHNRIVADNKATILATAAGGDVAFLNEWLLVDVAAVPANLSTLVWDGERLFQAARFSTEMQYQHLVFEEFARRIQPMVDPFVFNNSPEIDPSIVAEFAHTVYRFGHSMLTGTVDRLTNDLTTVDGADQATLLAVFLNPQAYIASGATLEEINANIVRGLTRDVGNSIDEFIVADVRSNLLGLPLDLGALNIARGRDTGIPSLNQTRAQLYNDSALADLAPYVSWLDFASNIKNAASIVNFIAAYGTHATITSETTLAGKRDAAEAIVFGGPGAPEDRMDFLNATGVYAGGNLGGLNDVDLWIGGLAEKSPEFGGMLGTTFNYVFEAQMEALQNGDRMYYLTRTQGTNFLNQLEPNTFADLVMRNTELGDVHATHLSGQLFLTPDFIIELDRGIAQEDYNGDASGYDPDWAPGEPHSPLDQKVTRIYNGATVNGHDDGGGTLRYKGGEHVVLGGTEGNDKIYGDIGDDTLWGDGGNDYLNGGTGADDVFGGYGNDIIEDPFGDDILRGNAGDDVITSSRGFDILFGNEGSDAIFIGQDASEVFAGSGNDFVLGGAGGDVINGNEGDDWIEGGAGFDGINGDNSELFFNSVIIGHDVLFAQADETDYDAESGDDIMLSGSSVFRYEGMFGFDWAIAKGDNAGVDFDLGIKIFTSAPDDILRDRFDLVEAISGYTFNDILEGDDLGRLHVGDLPGVTNDILFADNILTQEGINRINGFNAWFQGARQTLFGGADPLVAGSEVATSFRDGNIIMGGDGNDTLIGRGGYDLLDGDAYLNVRIGININGTYYSAESLNTDTSVAGQYAGRVYAMVGNLPNGEVNFAAGPAFGGRSLTSLLLDRTITTAQMSIVREIKYDSTNATGASMNIDTAVFQGTLAEYDIEGRTVNAAGQQLTRAQDLNGDGFISVHDRDDGVTGATVNGVVLPSRRLEVDETDLVKNIEILRFANGETLIIGGPGVNGAPSLDLNANVAGTGFTTTFTEDGAAVPIALNSSVADSDSPTLSSARIRLTNAQALDVLSIAGALPATITSSFGPPVAGEITLNLTGIASFADYQAAINAVRFANTSQNPNVAPRIILVTVSDAEGPSAAATATVNVVSVNDAPVTVADAIVTNISSGNIVVPEWVLLANDSDIDTPVLDITAVSAAVGITGLSLITNPGSVTFADDVTPGGTFTYTASDGNAVNGTTNGAVTMTNVSGATYADNFNGAGQVRSAANNSTGATSWAANSWTETDDDGNIRAGQIQIDGGLNNGTNDLRFGVGDGGSISRVINLAGVTSATLSLAFDKNGIDVGESVQVQFAADGVNFVTLNTITNTNNTGASGNAAGTLSLALTGALSANSTIRFVGSGINTIGEDIRIDNVSVAFGAPNAAVTAGAGNQILVGNEAGSSFTAGAGDDVVLANGGDDTINWSVGHGRDFVDGGANGAVGDRFIVNGDGTVETFVVYAVANAITAGVVVQNGATEIVITRNGVVVAELDNVEEITINTGAGADTVTAIGDFGPTSLFFNTITVNGARATIDASQLTSAHRLVLNGVTEEVAQVAVMPEFDGIGRAASMSMARKSMFDVGIIDFGLIGWRQNPVFSVDPTLDVLHTPRYHRAPALASDELDVVQIPQHEFRALHLFDAADYLI